MLLQAEDGFEVVAEAGDVATAERRVAAYHPRVLILDLNMPDESSLPAIPRLRESAPETQIVVLTMQNDPAFAREALRAGAIAYVLKEAAEIGAGPGGAAGGARAARISTPSLARGWRPQPQAVRAARRSLSARARGARLIALGHTNSRDRQRTCT